MPDSVAHFRWTPASGNPDGYIFETSSSHIGQVYTEELWIPWSWAGSGNEITFSTSAFRSNILGEVIEIGPSSLDSDPVIIVPDPPTALALAFGILFLLYLGRKRKH